LYQLPSPLHCLSEYDSPSFQLKYHLISLLTQPIEGRDSETDSQLLDLGKALLKLREDGSDG
jgi:hypothetical protein